MSIDYSEYHPKWTLISKLIRFNRAGSKCEWCAAPNYQVIYRTEKGKADWTLAPEGMAIEIMALDGVKFTRVILTVAHLDHDKKNNRFGNLAALCQRCHLNHDRAQHTENRRYGRNWKRDQLSLEL